MAFIEVHTLGLDNPFQLEETLIVNLYDIVVVREDQMGQGRRLTIRDKDDLLVSDTLEEIKAAMRRLDEL